MKNKIAFVFPGQGSQFVGMGRDFYDTYQVAREVINFANTKLDFDLKKLIFEGPLEELTKTIYCQPAIYVISFAILEVVRKEFPKIVPEVFAGHSLGEYTALTAAGSISFEDGLELVMKRAEFMQEAATNSKGAMLAVIGYERALIEKAMDSVSISFANINTPTQIILSGEKEQIILAENQLKGKAKKTVLLNVSGAFHSPLMKSAKEKLAPYIDNASIQSPTKGDFIMNVSGNKVTDQIKKNLKKQVTDTVEWSKIDRDSSSRLLY